MLEKGQTHRRCLGKVLRYGTPGPYNCRRLRGRNGNESSAHPQPEGRAWAGRTRAAAGPGMIYCVFGRIRSPSDLNKPLISTKSEKPAAGGDIRGRVLLSALHWEEGTGMLRARGPGAGWRREGDGVARSGTAGVARPRSRDAGGLGGDSSRRSEPGNFDFFSDFCSQILGLEKLGKRREELSYCSRFSVRL